MAVFSISKSNSYRYLYFNIQLFHTSKVIHLKFFENCIEQIIFKIISIENERFRDPSIRGGRVSPCFLKTYLHSQKDKMPNMFNHISWATYLAVISLASIAYYLFVCIKYYSPELLSFLSGKRERSVDRVSKEHEIQRPNFQTEQTYPDLYQSDSKYAPQVQETDDTFQQVEELTTKLKELISNAASKNSIKEEFILSLQIFLKKYRFLKGSPFQIGINNLIASECDKYAYMPLSSDEVKMLWNDSAI